MNAEIIAGIYGVPNAAKMVFPEQIHDHNITFLTGGDILSYIHLERISRIKYDAALHQYIEAFAGWLNLNNNKNLVLCFADHELGQDFISNGGKVKFKSSQIKGNIGLLREGTANWYGSEVKAFRISHEMAHIYSCIPFFGEFREESLMIHYDGGASLSNFSSWKYNNKQLTNINYHWRLKQYTNLFNANPLVFRLTGTRPKYHNSVPGKFMGLATHGVYISDIELWLRKNNFFSDIWKSPKRFFSQLKSDWDIELSSMDNKNSFLKNVAATIHEIFIRESLNEILDIKKKTRSKHLYFTGGCALNIKLNSALANSGEFENVFIPPCANDSGLSLGAAFAVSIQKGYKIMIKDAFLNNYNISAGQVKFNFEDIRRIAEMIQNYSVIGICNGYGETGPRALGNRSLLARANSKELAHKISMKIKGREWYRPLAPVMLKKHARYFTGLNEFPVSSKYMLFDFKIKVNRINDIAGVVHADNTSRIQIVEHRNQNPFLYDLLEICYELYGIRALINTSFNCKEEPIVQTSEDAKSSAKRMKLDALVVNGKLCTNWF